VPAPGIASGQGEEARIFFFLKKKEAKKTFPAGTRAGLSSAHASGQKFFGSFFQKRTRLLPS
jgi:hypothetical protein